MGLVIAGGGQQIVIDATASPYNVVGDNSTNNTTGLQAALNAAIVDIAGVSGNDDAARIVQLPPGRVKILDTVTVPTNVHLKGHGASASYLFRPTGGTGTTVLTTSGVQNTLSDFGVICNDYLVDCITFVGSGASILSDARQVARDVICVGGRDGFTAGSTNANEIRLTRCATYRTARHGFRFATTDGFLEGCTAAAAGTGSHAEYTGSQIWGVYCAGNNWRLYGCKAFGQLGSAGGGFYVGDRNQIVGCEAQDNQALAFQIGTNNGFVMASGLLSDSNGTGFIVKGQSSLSSSQAIVRGGGLYTTGTALAIGAADIGGAGPLIRNFAQSGCTRLYSVGATLIGSLDLMNRYGAQSVAYAATITPDPWAGQDVIVGPLTGNLTIANPATSPDGASTPYPIGMELCFQLTQDATGARAITFGANYKTTTAIGTSASSATYIRFKFDGTFWREVSRAIT